MAISDSGKIDYLWKKLGYGVAKTDTNAAKKAPNEAIVSPLLIRGDKVWTKADKIPATKPGSTTTHVRIYDTTTSIECTEDGTSTARRTWKTGLTDWIPPEFGSTYLVKIYSDAASAANPVSSGTQLFGTGSGNNDEWFFDYQAGIVHFIGTNIPSSVSGSRKVYVAGARYIGAMGIGSANNFVTVGAKEVQANTVTVGTTSITRANNTIKTTNTVVTGTATINTLNLSTALSANSGGTGIRSFTVNGVPIGATAGRLAFVTGTNGEFLQIAANGTPTFGDIDGSTY